MTNYADYACSTDGVNMNTHNQACIAKLEFGEPSQTYNGNSYIENTLNLFLSNLDCFISNKPLENKVDRVFGY